MSEQSVVSVRATVMVYDEGNKKWIPSGSSPGLSKVDIYSHSTHVAYRVVGRKLNDQEVVINCGVMRGMKYNQATPTFHQWRDSRTVYGLNFPTKDDADAFALAMVQAIDAINSGSGTGNMTTPQPQQLAQHPMTMAPRNAAPASAPRQPPPAPPSQVQRSPATSPTGPPANPMPTAATKPQPSGGGPPPPPPPPMPMPIAMNVTGSPTNCVTPTESNNSLASALGNALARKAQSDGNQSTPTTPEVQASKNGGGGGGSLMDEMARAFAKRKAGGTGGGAGGQKDGNSGSSPVKSGSGSIQSAALTLTAFQKPKPANASATVHSPSKVQVKTLGSDSAGITSEEIMVNGLNNNHESGLEALKSEILREVRQELNKMKNEIIEVIRSEMSKK